ncbi:MAG: ABC transporter substrate-binding protein [Rhizobiales bacterium]|nr:ABC transporter substrate-binding protein [Hyphomicrobiales bacterium]
MLRRFAARLSFVATSLACVIAMWASPPAGAQERRTLKIDSFKSATLWPMWAAQKTGAFDKHGLAIELSYTRNSKSQLTGVIEGKFDMITTALDNVIAYSEGEGAPGTPKNGDLIAFLGGNNGSLGLIAQPQYKSPKDFKGADLAVDAISTGFSFVLREILVRNGLGPDDYKLTAVGATGARWQALQKKETAAALLTPPFTLIAAARGFSNVAEANDVLGGYQGSVSATRRDWAAKNADTIVRYIRAYRAGQVWLMAPANKDAAIAILKAEFPQMADNLTQTTYKMLVTENKGFNPGAKIDMAGAKTVLDLRRRYGPKGKTITNVAHFIDERYFNTAIKP